MYIRLYWAVLSSSIIVKSPVYNLDHNFLGLFNVSVDIWLTTSKFNRGICYSKLSIRVASQVAEQLATWDLGKKENISKISNLGGHIPQCPVPFPEIKLW